MSGQSMADTWMAKHFITDLYATYRQFFCPSVLPLPISCFMVLFMLQEDGELSVKDICARLFLTRQQMTPILRKLVTDGYAKKGPSLSDRRCIMVELTEAGRTAVQEYWDDLCQRFAEHKKKEVHSFGFSRG